VPRHVGFLARLLLVWSAFNAIVGLALCAFGVAAALVARNPAGAGPGIEVAAGITAATLLLVGVSALVWAVAHYSCGRGLTRRRRWARSLALALAVFDLLLVPLGTAVGLYAVWVLLHEDARRLFDAAAESPVPQGQEDTR